MIANRLYRENRTREIIRIRLKGKDGGEKYESIAGQGPLVSWQEIRFW
jgi:hypothetical protein